MLPFMAGQSMMMGDAFGKSYQYGKRKISAMSNEEFNLLTPDELQKEIIADFTTLIPNLKVAMEQSTAFQKDIIIEMGKILGDLPDIVKQFIFGTPEPFGLEPGPTPIPPPPDESIYSWIDRTFNNLFIPQMLSGIGITTAVSNYQTIVNGVSNFLAGVDIMNRKIIDDAIQLARDILIREVEIPPQPTPEPPPVEEPIAEPTPDQSISALLQEFYASLVEIDFKTGGHRHRSYKGTIMHWIVPNKWIRKNNGGTIDRYDWIDQKWTQVGQGHTFNTNAQFLNKVNNHKTAIGASHVRQYNQTTGDVIIYFILNTHQN